MFKFAVLTVSDRASNGDYDDKSGKAIIEYVKKIGATFTAYHLVTDDIEPIKKNLLHYTDELKVDIVFTTGGTGLGPRDVTPEATLALGGKEVKGISELMRVEGCKKTKNASLSRGVAVLKAGTLIINLPGSPQAVNESLEAVSDILGHAVRMIRGEGH